MRKTRVHAGFFESPKKEIKEVSICTRFFSLLEDYFQDYIVLPKSAEDPPDVSVLMMSGVLYGVELVELVNQTAIEKQVKDDPDRDYARELFVWNKDKTIDAVRKVIKKKKIKCKNKIEKYGYDKHILLIHTNEPRLGSDNLKKYLSNFKPKRVFFDEIWIIVGYEPEHNTTPLIKIK